MAYVMLKAMNAPSEVSSATIDAASGKAAVSHCVIRDFKTDAQGISFTRQDESSPFWIDDAGAQGLELIPTFQDELNRMPLRIDGLAAGQYALAIDGQAQGTFTAEQPAAGINLAANRKSPVYDPGRVVAEIISKTTWRNADMGAQKEKAAQHELEVEATEDKKLNEAAQAAAIPKPHHHELTRINTAS